jgi:transcription factor E2F3
MSGMETPPRPTPTIRMDSLENPRTPLAAECGKSAGIEPNIQEGFTLPPDAPSSSQDNGGMMKIVPSELDVSSLRCIIVQQVVQNEIDLSMIMYMFFHPLNFT